MGETISQRVNALFAAYVANELEQDRLGRAGDDAGAQALCAPTIAIREQVLAIRDRSGCADLIAARLLLDLMLVTRWNADEGLQIGFEDQETVLPMLEILADSTTGTVRQQAAKALATIGVHVAPEAADPMLALVSEYRRLHESLSDIPDDDEANQRWADVLAPLWARLTQTPPAPTTHAGAAAAIRLVRDESRGSYAPDLIQKVLTITADALDAGSPT
ncbi:hypothetical protein ACP4J4_20375 (plasmid) [Aureimonas ureilytica]|uniref:hypothetical protein n=1 Tax=Aureimonas ureilytica TaxID=401562 RepID=UPI003CF18088